MSLGNGISRIWNKVISNTALRWHTANKVSRMEAIQRSLDELRAVRYLEIGVDAGVCFSTITAAEKIGIDPVNAAPLVVAELQKPGVQYFPLTSDAFFSEQAEQVLPGGVDVVFIDGLHTYEQTYRDCINSLRFLKDRGVILLHDCLPKTALEATPATSHQDAMRINGPLWDGYWTGDSWKAIVALRALHPGVSACVLETDQGLGLVFKGAGDAGPSLVRAQIDALTFDDLIRDRRGLLGLRKPAHLLRCLRKLRVRRAGSVAG